MLPIRQANESISSLDAGVWRLAAIGLLLAQALGAQDARVGSIKGLVVQDSTRRPIPDALVEVIGLNRTTRTGQFGEFRLTAVPVGTWALVVRRPGLRPRAERVEVTEGIEAQPTLVLDRLPQILDTALVTERSVAGSPIMREFERRKKFGLGSFIGPEELRRMDGRKLTQILRTVPGTRWIAYRGWLYLASSRGETHFNTGGGVGGSQHAIASDNKSPKACWIQIIIDGSRIFAINAGNDVPDMSAYEGREFEAIEFYRGPAVTPPEFSFIGASCGTLVLWTRQR